MNITLKGEKLVLRKMKQSELEGIYTEAVLNFYLYAAEYKSCEFILCEPQKKECNRYTHTDTVFKYSQVAQ